MVQASALTAHGFDDRPASEAACCCAFSAGGVEVSIAEALEPVERDWRAFEREADGAVFQSFAWLSTWQRHIGARRGVRPAIVIGRADDGRMLFLLPLATQPTGFARELVWLGMELCDYTGPLLAPDFSRYFPAGSFGPLWRHVAQTLAEHPHLGFDLIRLEKMPETVGAQRNPMLDLSVTRHPSGAYSTPLPASWDAFYATKRSASTRRRDRTKRKNLAALGEVRLVEPETNVERLQSLETLMQQKARAFARMGVSNLFARPGYAEFYRALTGETIAHVSRLDVGAHPAAVNLGLMAHGRYYHLLASYTDDAEIARFGPGAAHLMDLMANAIRRGCTIFDFTIGDEPYKLDWCEARQTLHDHLAARTPIGAATTAVHTAKLRLKRRIKESPALWSAFYKLRAALARVKINPNIRSAPRASLRTSPHPAPSRSEQTPLP